MRHSPLHWVNRDKILITCAAHNNALRELATHFCIATIFHPVNMVRLRTMCKRHLLLTVLTVTIVTNAHKLDVSGDTMATFGAFGTVLIFRCFLRRTHHYEMHRTYAHF